MLQLIVMVFLPSCYYCQDGPGRFSQPRSLPVEQLLHIFTPLDGIVDLNTRL